MDYYDMFNGTCPEDLPLDDSPIDTDNVLAMVRGDLGRAKRPRKLGRTVRVGLIAAALIVALGVTAYAVYEMFIDKYVIEQPFELETDEKTEEQSSRARISLTGYQGTPEYQAYTEWEAYEDDWWEKAMEHNPWQERGVDDSWHETPDNYAYLYDASFQEQADALDAIIEKYGLTLHQDRAVYYQTKDLYEALGTEPFFNDSIDPIAPNYDVGGYIYDDGSFKAEFRELLSGDRRVDMSVFVNAKGSFAIISGSAELSEDSEAWEYTTASGKTVDLYLSPNSAVIMTESPGAYIYVGVKAGGASGYDPATDPNLSEEQKAFVIENILQNEPDLTEAEQEAAWQEYYDSYVRNQRESLPPAITKEDLEIIADSVDFAVLADRFDGAPHPETADMLPVLQERENARYEASTAAAAERKARSADALAQLGRYAPSVLPASFADWLWGVQEPLDPDLIGLEGKALSCSGNYTPTEVEVDTLVYYRITDSPTEPAAYISTIREFLAERYPDGEVTDETVQGHPAAMVLLPDHGAVYWYDEDADLLFAVSIDDMRYKPAVEWDAVLALAESVEKVG